MMHDVYVGIDVAFAKRKRLPVVMCHWQGDRLVPYALRKLGLEPPTGRGNRAACDPDQVSSYAREAADYLRNVEAALGVRIARVGIDAPSAPRRDGVPRRAAEAALDRAGISCFTTPSHSNWAEILRKVDDHLTRGGEESRMPHANQLWMLVGFALFSVLAEVAPCVEVYPQATVRHLGLSPDHKSKTGVALEQLQAVSRTTGWPQDGGASPALADIAWGPVHDRVDAYLSAWVAALNENSRSYFGSPPDDVIWVPKRSPQKERRSV